MRALVREEFVLRDARPGHVALRVALVPAEDFLEECDVGVEPAQALANVVQDQLAVELRETLVDVVGDRSEERRVGKECRL